VQTLLRARNPLFKLLDAKVDDVYLFAILSFLLIKFFQQFFQHIQAGHTD
jgi:hypothetical protein